MANIAHRDIKPENMMLDKNENLVLTDFGVSQFFSSKDDLLFGTHGTMRYMAPEMVTTGKKKVMHGKHVDMWALGITIFRLVTNDYPFKGETIPEL